MAHLDNRRDLIAAENEALQEQLANAAAQIEEQGRQLLIMQDQIADEQRQINERDREIALLQQQPIPVVPNNDIDSILKQMQSPQIIRDMPCFTGDPVKLNTFIKAVDRLMPTLERARGTAVFDVWMQSIRAKITQEADAVLELYGTDTEWDDIKNTLTTHFGDKRDEISLTRDLFKLTQTNCVQEFYGNVSHAVSLLVNLLNLNEPNPVVVSAKKIFYQELGLKVFLSGLKEPLGPIIRAQSPKTLKEALRLCLEEGNYNYVKNHLRAPPPPPVPAKPSYNIPKPLQFPTSNQLRLLQYPKPFQFPYLQNQRPPLSNHQIKPFTYPQQQKPFNFSPQIRPMQFPQQQRPFQFHPPQRSFQFGQQPPRQFPSNPNFPKQPKPTPMEIDHSIRSNQVNYLNRPNYHLEEYLEPNAIYDEYYPYQMYDVSEYPEYVEMNNYTDNNNETPEADNLDSDKSVSVDDLNFRERVEGDLTT